VRRREPSKRSSSALRPKEPLTSAKRNGPRKITLRPFQLGRPSTGTVLASFSLKILPTG
jgi:hypothetical protein